MLIFEKLSNRHELLRMRVQNEIEIPESGQEKKWI
jgi:hypothetical protein